MTVTPSQTLTGIDLGYDISFAEFGAVQVHKYYISREQNRHIKFPEAHQNFHDSGEFEKWHSHRFIHFMEKQREELEALRHKGYTETEAMQYLIDNNYAAKHREKRDNKPTPHGVLLVNGTAIKTISGEYWSKLIQQNNCDVFARIVEKEKVGMAPYQFRLEGNIYVDAKSEQDMHALNPVEGDHLELVAYGEDKNQVKDTLEEVLKLH